MTVVSKDGRYEWDSEKDALNVVKHGFSFKEILEVFDDPYLLTRYDKTHSMDEDRYVSIGRVNGFVVIFAVYAERDGRTRIISARDTNAKERSEYYDNVRRFYHAVRGQRRRRQHDKL